MSDFVTAMAQELLMAQTPPDVYRLHLVIQRRALPAEIAALAAHPLTPAASKAWLSSLMLGIFPDGEAPVNCTGRRVARSVNFYQGEAPRKVLVAGFSGRANLLFGPVALFLQSLIGMADVLVLSDPQQQGFTSGIPGYAPTFGDLLERIAADVGLNRYDDIRTLGTSGGGAAAVAAGRKLSASVMLSFSGRLPTKSREYGESSGAAEIEAMIRDVRGAGQAFAVYASENKRDAANGELLGELGGATPIVLRGSDSHNTVNLLVKAGKLRSFLNQVGMLAPPGHVVPLSRTIG